MALAPACPVQCSVELQIDTGLILELGYTPVGHPDP